MNKRILLSSLTIFATVMMVTASTFAFFSSQGQSLGNTFSTGSLDLRLEDGNETNATTVTASFGGNLAPGQCAPSATLFLKNTGSIVANHVAITVTNALTDTNDNAAVDMHNFLKLQTLTYDGNDMLSSLSDANSNGFADLADWQAMAGGLDNLALNNLDSSHPLVVEVCLDESAPNTIQGDSVTTDLTAVLNQDASQ